MELRPKSKPRAFAKPYCYRRNRSRAMDHESIRFRIRPGLIIVLPMMVAMATVVPVAIVITWIPGGAIINAPVVIIPIARIAVAAIVIARLVISRCHTHAEAEVLSF